MWKNSVLKKIKHFWLDYTIYPFKRKFALYQKMNTITQFTKLKRVYFLQITSSPLTRIVKMQLQNSHSNSML